MSNEIKLGDKVRVREDAPRMYAGYSGDKVFEVIFDVKVIEDDNAIIKYVSENVGAVAQFPIPLKYLIKVDAEAKEAKYHKGDRVRFKNIYELQKVKDKSFRWMLVMFASKEATITAVEDNGFYRVDIYPSIGGINDDMIECKVEPTEQTEAEKPNHTIKIPVEVDLKEVAKEYAEAMSNAIRKYGDALCKHGTFIRMVDDLYKRDLAKEVALKVANKYNTPHEAAEYAVSVAKAVVEGLKRK